MPYTGIVLAILAAFLAAFLILIAHWIAAVGMFPRAVEKLADTYERRAIRATLIGIFTYGPLQFLFLNAGNIKSGVGKFVALFLGFGSLLVALIGTAGLAMRIGRNLSPNGDRWQQALRGGVMLALVFITPILGWFFMLPIGLASGFGAIVLARPWKARVPSLPLEIPAPSTPEPVLS
jgi:hypothetical protein